MGRVAVRVSAVAFCLVLRIKKLRVQANLDADSVLNSGGIRSIISQFGPRWRNASQVLDPRLIQLGGQISF